MPSDYTTRSRWVNRLDAPCKYGVHFRTTTPTESNVNYYSEDFEELYSRRNGWPRASRTRDVGGDFLKKTFSRQDVRYAIDAHTSLHSGSWTSCYFIRGNLSARPVQSRTSVSSVFGTIMATSNDLTVAGTRFVSEASPTKPRAGLTVALTELKREGLPRARSELFEALDRQKITLKDVEKLRKGSASDYLNWQFGWLPLVADIRAMAKSVMEADYLLSQLYRDNGRLVTRFRGSSTFARVLNESSSVSSSYGLPVGSTYLYPKGGGQQLLTSKTERRQWFSGAFMYHLPEQVSEMGRFRSVLTDARYLYGLAVDPINVWNLVPWSWLIDWFGNAGECISTLSDQIYNQQVLKYGYTMAHTTRVDKYSTSVIIGVDQRRYNPSTTFTYDVKQRMQATPFGFGLNWSGFTPYQLSILTALGLSRGK